ncbi:PaaX family transcriptional regulator C-terminal domain-containing protein [Microbacterium sp. CIAB417]|uniref:PaaX family transcriptional regulator n=1 Tax=Microbacterium sp. CIAB417 TaxID=2860287 RepID=UPI001FADF468|nr:PaaX family transcriptional regulator C-terminal domain-containing protein [Microbacterium sp. CIAB417]
MSEAIPPVASELASEDDFDARPGSTVSLLRTIVGLYLRPLGGWIAAADLVRLAGDLGIPESRARTGIARLKQRGLLQAERASRAGYRLNPTALRMLERGDRRIFAVRRMAPGDAWCLISFSVPESRRDVRHRLRRRLQWIGAGLVSPALWICPAFLQDEADEILVELGIRDSAVLFRTETPQVAGRLADAVGQWWDLAALRAEHEAFLSAVAELPDAATDRDAFAAYVRLIDAWRVIPYLDPGLPTDLLPADWPGERSFTAFATLSAALAERARAHVGLPD